MAKKPRSWLTFSLRTLLILTLVSSVVLGVLGARARTARKQKQAVDKILELGGSVRYDGSYSLNRGGLIRALMPSSWEQPLRQRLGNDYFDTVVEVDFFRAGIDDQSIEVLRGVPNIEILHLGMTKITDNALWEVRNLKYLRRLTLQVTRVTDEGLPRLKKLKRLEYVILPSTTGKVTSEGIEQLQTLLPQCEIDQ